MLNYPGGCFWQNQDCSEKAIHFLQQIGSIIVKRKGKETNRRMDVHF
jgi:hypothetical protein